MSFVGYLWGGLIRVGYDYHRSYGKEFHRFEKTIETQAKGTIREIIAPTKKDIREKIRTRYTYKGAISIRSRVSGMSGQITVRGKRENVKKKFIARGGKGRSLGPYRGAVGPALYISVLRGKGGIIRRGFIMYSKGKFRNTAWRRDTEARIPMHMLYGPSTAEMAGHEPMPARAIELAVQRRLEEKVGGLLG